jgi:hypothetical protein
LKSWIRPCKQFHLQLKSEQKEIIQNVLEEKIQWQCYPWASERACVTSPPLILDKVRSYMQIIFHDTVRCGNRSFLEVTW